jgi:hypothetical protein
MDKAALLTLFQCLVPPTWFLFILAYAMALFIREQRLRRVALWVLFFSNVALAVVTIDAMRAGVWG